MIKIEHIVKEFNSLKAVNDVSLEIKKGEIVCLIGPSGSGKSTLLHILGGVETPTSGKLFVDGADVFSKNRTQLAIAYYRAH